MKAAILADTGNEDGSPGGAEFTMREFAMAAPDEVELVDVSEAEVVAIGNCRSYGRRLIPELAGKRVVRYHHDFGRAEDPDLREWLEVHAEHIWTSPLHRRLAGQEGEVIPPPIDQEAFRPSRQTRRHGIRVGTCAIGSWHNPSKGQRLLLEWARKNEPVDVYGHGSDLWWPEPGQGVNVMGALDYSQVAQTLWKYQRFIHLPTAPEPFGRGVVEAWAAGCDLVLNHLVGALYFIQEAPEELEGAADRFWELLVGARV